ncbi:hypothetical protein DNTS_027851 [Danionella cerebrum]|uniref:F-box domain-containing protein n=1 Tax=Danionella cerebrum TaxID=2873325 RepID=A0A553RMY8_9TELE|nr:hypothetical protein DNTS_027851 [Danionella translucida]
MESVQLQVLEGHEESIRVLDMVAKLESQCLKRQSFVENGGDLSRNSLRRKVGRVLLAGSQSYPLPVSPTVNRDCEVECVVQVMGGDAGNLKSTCNTFETIKCGLDCSSISRKVSSKAVETETIFQSSKDAVSNCSEEPLPGMLFFAKSYLQPIKEQHFSDSKSNSQNEGPFQLCKHTADPFKAENERFEENMEEETALGNQEPVPFPLHRIVSHEFLETRFKIQLLLEPQQYMASLPHHIILKIFCLLPTQSLVALKCTCNYFKFIIERYCIRPADCQWVIDPRYKDDPCKQCKKRYNHGDISLCRWHHKPYCQALPYGPGYWMCCRRAHKDSPGCNVGLHDNRWVPALSRHTNLQGQLGQW